jgi:hypothetical protein
MKEIVIFDASPALPGWRDIVVEFVKEPTGWIETIEVETTGPSTASVAIVSVSWFKRTPLTGRLISRFDGSLTVTLCLSLIVSLVVNTSCWPDAQRADADLKIVLLGICLSVYLLMLNPGKLSTILSPAAIDISATNDKSASTSFDARTFVPTKTSDVDCINDPIAGVL